MTTNSGLGNRGWTQAVGQTDIKNDGSQDIIIGKNFGVKVYYINQKPGIMLPIQFRYKHPNPPKKVRLLLRQEITEYNSLS